MKILFSKFGSNFTKKEIIVGLISAFLFSSFIYFEYFGLSILNFLSLFGYFLLFKIDKKSFIVSGFFIGIFWFWWIGLSFRYYNLPYLIPFVILGLGIIFAVIFYLIGLFNNKIIRAILFFSLSFIHPFGFNWFKPELPIINLIDKNSKLYINQNIIFKNIKIFIPEYNIPQNIKWDKNYLSTTLKLNENNIKYAIKKGFDMIILPETAYPLVLNYNKKLLIKLKNYSKKITIVAGALNYQNNQFYNSSFIFQNNSYIIANKVILVPFGEKTPLPKPIVNLINKIFFNGASDYKQAKYPTYYTVKNIKFLNAICYEATVDKFYTNCKTHNVVVLSNMAWFQPSIASTLQTLLLKYFAFKYNLTIFHSVNLY